jgi:hypothetical protein
MRGRRRGRIDELLICQPDGKSESLQGEHHALEAITAAANCAFASSNVAARPWALT